MPEPGTILKAICVGLASGGTSCTRQDDVQRKADLNFRKNGHQRPSLFGVHQRCHVCEARGRPTGPQHHECRLSVSQGTAAKASRREHCNCRKTGRPTPPGFRLQPWGQPRLRVTGNDGEAPESSVRGRGRERHVEAVVRRRTAGEERQARARGAGPCTQRRVPRRCH